MIDVEYEYSNVRNFEIEGHEYSDNFKLSATVAEYKVYYFIFMKIYSKFIRDRDIFYYNYTLLFADDITNVPYSVDRLLRDKELELKDKKFKEEAREAYLKQQETINA